MTGPLSVRPVARADRSLIDDQARTYYAEVLPDGPVFYPAMLDRYWEEPGRHPYVIRLADKVVGFALVWNHADGTHELAEFTIAPAFRDSGLGTRAALQIFEALGGRWTLGVAGQVPAALGFWQACLSKADVVHELIQGPPKTDQQVCSFTFVVAR